MFDIITGALERERDREIEREIERDREIDREREREREHKHKPAGALIYRLRRREQLMDPPNKKMDENPQQHYITHKRHGTDTTKQNNPTLP